MKYGNLFVKTLIALILLKYKILPCNDLNEDLCDIDHFILGPKPNADVKFEEL